MHLALVADGTEVFVDAKHDQDEFRDNPREYDTDDHAGDRGQQHDETAERADRHRRQAGKDAGDAEQRNQRDHQPVEGLDDGGRDEAVPLKQIPKLEHRSFSPGKSISVASNPGRSAQGLAPKVAPGKRREATVLARRARAMRTGPLRLPQITATIRPPLHQSPSFAPIPMMTLTFEDFPPGHFGTFGPRHVTREEMLAFAAEFDPQPMHLDEEAAKQSMLKGLSGSGWHLCSIMMRMMFDGFIGRTASLGSPGVNELRWLAPLRPGDDLTLDVEVAEARVSRSRPGTGIVTFKGLVRNAAGVALCEMVSPIIVQRRAAIATGQAG